MKKVKYLLLVFMALVVLTGCEINVNNDKKDSETEVVEKDTKDDTKKDNKKDNKKDDTLEGVVSFDKIEDAYDKIEDNSEETLVCELSEAGQDFEMTVGFKKDEINTMGVEMVMNLKDYGITADQFEQVADLTGDQLLEAMGLNKGAKGIAAAIKTDKDDLSMTIKIVINFKEADPEVVDTLGINFSEEDLKHSYKEIKEEAIAQGYNCK